MGEKSGSASRHVRQRFVLLDGIRGIAAIAVMLFHLFPQLPGGVIGHGYLAVDLFFLLSGFVIAHNYDGKIARGLSLGRFAAIRAIRLYPLAIAAIVAAALLRLIYPRPTLPTGSFLYDLGANLLLLPNSTDEMVEKFAFVPPSWSLFFELTVNLIYAAIFPWLRKATLLCLMIVFGAMLTISVVEQGSVELLHRDIVFGMVRTAFSFTYGVIISRYALGGGIRIGRPTLLVYVVLVLVIGAPMGYANTALYDLIVIVAVFPVLVWICVSNPSDRVSPLQEELGELSYPIYLFHMPVMAYVGVALGWALDGVMLGVVATLATLVAAALAWRFYDRPVRSWLQHRLLGRGDGNDPPVRAWSFQQGLILLPRRS